MAKDLKAFLKRITEDSAFAEEARVKGKSIAEAEKISDDKELTVRVGKEMGYEFTVADLNQIELDKEPEKYAAKAEEKLKLDEDSLKSVAGGSSENEWNVARACDEHDWVYCGLVKGEYWGYNRRFVCSKCGAEDYCWDKWPWQD